MWPFKKKEFQNSSKHFFENFCDLPGRFKQQAWFPLNNLIFFCGILNGANIYCLMYNNQILKIEINLGKFLT